MSVAIKSSVWSDPSTLAFIYNADTNIAIWDRRVSSRLSTFSFHLCSTAPNFQARMCGNLTEVQRSLEKELPNIQHKPIFVADVVLLTDMFCELFGLDGVGLRLAVLSKAMCPKFHVDRVPARLVTTYCGEGTEWVKNCYVKRKEPYRIDVAKEATVKQLKSGHVALLKGESWEGNDGKGLVHRSPTASMQTPRLVLTLDFV